MFSSPPDRAGRLKRVRTSRAARAVGRLLGGPSRNDPAQIIGALDGPLSGSVLPRLPTRVRGWALAGDSAVDEVHITVGGARLTAQTGEIRPDVSAANGGSAVSERAGWSVVVDFGRYPAGDLPIEVIAIKDGYEHAIATALVALRESDVIGHIDSPIDGAVLPNRLLVLAGWARAGRGVSRVELRLDGRPLGRARTGVPRGDVWEADTDRHSPTPGFEFRGAVPVDDDLPHEVAVTIVDMDGHSLDLGALRVRFSEPRLEPEDALRAGHLRERTTQAVARACAVEPDPEHLLVFTHSLSVGGGQLYLQELLRNLIGTLRQCTVISNEDGIYRHELEALGADVVVDPRGMPATVESYEGQVRGIEHTIQASGAGAVLLNTIGQCAAADAAQRAGRPTIWAIHESFAVEDWLDVNCGGVVHPYVMERIELALSRTTRLIFEAEATRSMYLQRGAREDAALVIPYGIDIDEIDRFRSGFDPAQTRQQLGIDPAARVLTCVGVFEPRKSQGALIEAFGRVMERHSDTVLILVGDHPCPYSEALHRLAADIPAGRIRFIPIDPHIFPLYGITDLFVSASDVESMPRSMLSAMAFGAPVLAASVFGVSELLTEGETGWLMEPRDTRALVAALHRVLRLDGESRRRVGERGRALVRERYRSSGYVEAYRAMVAEVAAPGTVGLAAGA